MQQSKMFVCVGFKWIQFSWDKLAPFSLAKVDNCGLQNIFICVRSVSDFFISQKKKITNKM